MFVIVLNFILKNISIFGDILLELCMLKCGMSRTEVFRKKCEIQIDGVNWGESKMGCNFNVLNYDMCTFNWNKVHMIWFRLSKSI